MQAIKSLLLGNNGVDITPLVQDLTSAREEPINTDEISVKIALLISGKMPEFKSYEGHVKDWNQITSVRVLAESSLEGTLKVKYFRRWKFDKESGTYKLDNKFQPYMNIVRTEDFRFMTAEEFDKVILTD